MKQALMLATVPSMIGQFNMPNIKILQDIGCNVHVACNFEDYSAWPHQRIEEFKRELNTKKISWHQVNFQRNALKLYENHVAYKQVLAILKKEKIDFIHCHTPVGGVIGRLAAYRCKIKIVYTAHGFHFYKGAPLLNWMVYYPVEKLLSYITYIIITINKEDYERAIKQFHAKRIEYVPGVGVEIDNFKNQNIDVMQKREELNISKTSLVLLSVGEINKNKNHKTIIKALNSLKEESFFLTLQYIICGQGALRTELEEMVNDLHLEKTIHFLGFRDDIKDLYKVADIFVFPSFREGLSVALMEAMANGLPVIGSKVRGNVDLIECEKSGYLVNPSNYIGFRESIKKLFLQKNIRSKMGKYNQNRVKKFSCVEINKKMMLIYTSMVI